MMLVMLMIMMAMMMSLLSKWADLLFAIGKLMVLR